MVTVFLVWYLRTDVLHTSISESQQPYSQDGSATNQLHFPTCLPTRNWKEIMLIFCQISVNSFLKNVLSVIKKVLTTLPIA